MKLLLEEEEEEEGGDRGGSMMAHNRYEGTAVSAGIQMEKALGLYKHLSFLFIYSLSDRFTKNL